MPPLGRSLNYDPEISWKTLAQYARAVREFTGSKGPVLPRTSFAKISAMDSSDLPPARYFPLPGGGLGYRWYAAAKSRRALVLIHGSACFGDQLHAIARHISRRDLAQVYTLNMRGHGLADGRPGHAAAAPDQMVGDVAAFLEHLRTTGAADSIILGGHSAGGGLALAISRTFAEGLVDGYLFLAPYLGLGSPVNRPRFGGWVDVRPLQLLAVAAANLFGVTRFNDTTVIDFNPEACARERRYVPSWSFATLLAFGPGRWIEEALPIPPNKPVLLVAGRGDECFHQPLYRDAFHIIAPHAEMPDVGNGGHWDILVEPASLGAIDAWLTKQPEAHRAPTDLHQPHWKVSKAA